MEIQGRKLKVKEKYMHYYQRDNTPRKENIDKLRFLERHHPENTVCI
jgi:hypothetical protein